MGDDRYRNTDPQHDYYNRSQPQDYGRDYGSGRSDSYSSARSYQAAGEFGGGRNRDRGYGSGGGAYGQRDQGGDRYGQQGRMQGRDYYGGRSDWDQDRQRMGGGGDRPYHGSYAHDGERWEDVGRYRHADDDNRSGYGDRDRSRGTYGRQPQGYQYEDRGFFQRAGDEVRSWFGDDDAERRREHDARMDEQRYDNDRDSDYHSWRRGQIDALDRDYHEYRQENRSKFHNEFGAWRTNRQGQRDSLSKVTEHQDVVGSDGEHVGTVDKVRDDRIILTKSDADAGGRHHSIPSSWIQTVDTKVTLSKTAQQAKDQWRDEERSGAMFGNDQNRDQNQTGQSGTGTGKLNRSFSGTY